MPRPIVGGKLLSPDIISGVDRHGLDGGRTREHKTRKKWSWQYIQLTVVRME